MAVQAIAAVLWAIVIPNIKNTKFGYSLSLVIGASGFISMYFFRSEAGFWISEILIGCAWAAALAYPFTLLTNAIQGKGHMGTYLGLFNGTICLPQIVAAISGGFILHTLPMAANGAPNEPMMMVIGGIFLLCGAVSVFAIKEK